MRNIHNKNAVDCDSSMRNLLQENYDIILITERKQAIEIPPRELEGLVCGEAIPWPLMSWPRTEPGLH